MLISNALEDNANQHPFACAVLSENSCINFKWLNELVWQNVVYLLEQGISHKSRVGLHFINPVTHYILSLAILRIGAAQTGLLSSNTPTISKQIIDDCELSHIISDINRSRFDIKKIVINQENLNQQKPADERPEAHAKKSDTAILIIGSGTTGESKIIPITHGNLEHLVKRDLLARPMQAQERHFSAINIAYYTAKRRIFASLLVGATTVICEDPAGPIAPFCDKYAVDHLSLSIIHAQNMIKNLKKKNIETIRLPQLKSVFIGGSPISEPLRLELRTKLSAYTIIAYGSNEFGEACIAPPTLQDKHVNTIGLPCADVQIEIVDDENTPCPQGVTGHIRMQASGMFEAYQDNAEQTDKHLVDGWFYPGDLGIKQEDGSITFMGRSDDLINFEGVNIYPREIEVVLEKNEWVTEVAAFPMNIDNKEYPIAAVVISNNAKTPTPEACADKLKSLCEEHLSWRSPHKIFQFNHFPRNSAGKILKRELREIINKHLTNGDTSLFINIDE